MWMPLFGYPCDIVGKVGLGFLCTQFDMRITFREDVAV